MINGIEVYFVQHKYAYKKYSVIFLYNIWAKTEFSGKHAIKKKSKFWGFSGRFLKVGILILLNQHENCEAKPKSPLKKGICDRNPKPKK